MLKGGAGVKGEGLVEWEDVICVLVCWCVLQYGVVLHVHVSCSMGWCYMYMCPVVWGGVTCTCVL